MRLESKVALITGGYGGMGRASARLFAREGATVFVAGRNQERGDALIAEINGAGGKAHFVELDVVNQDQWDAAITQVKKQAGALHVLMNIVGSNALVKFPDVDIEQWNKIFEINVTGTTPPRSGPLRDCRGPRPTFTPTGASAQTSSSPAGSKPT